MERTATKYAVIDVGSNSVRFALERGGGLGEKRVFTTRLGSGLNETGRLAEGPMRMSLEVICRCASEARSLGFTPVAYATSAVRDAVNGAEFVREVESACGVPVEVLPGETEARYAFLGAAGGGGRFDTLLDIGGASMQVVTADSAVSFRAGCVRCADTIAGVRSHGGIDLVLSSPTHEWDICPYAKRDALRAYLDREVRLPAAEHRRLVGVGGTITTLAAYSLKLGSYDPAKVDGAELLLSWLGPAFYMLCSLGDEGRRAVPILASRHDTVLTGLVILQYAMEKLGVEALTVSTRDGMEGYLGHVKARR